MDGSIEDGVTECPAEAYSKPTTPTRAAKKTLWGIVWGRVNSVETPTPVKLTWLIDSISGGYGT